MNIMKTDFLITISKIFVLMIQSKGIPLCLPNNMTWDPATGKTRTTSEERSSLYVVPTAIELLQKIKGTTYFVMCTIVLLRA